MSQKLPVEIDPFRLARNKLILEGDLALATMKRLSQSLCNNDGNVHIKMNFDMDKITSIPYMQGVFTASLSLLCERCSKPVAYDVEINCLLALLSSENKIESLGEQYDPWLIESDDPIKLSSVVEDELILALPLVAKHNEICLPKEVWQVGEEEVVVEEKKAPSPFAMLASLKTNK